MRDQIPNGSSNQGFAQDTSSIITIPRLDFSKSMDAVNNDIENQRHRYSSQLPAESQKLNYNSG
jgi:hypothetical protein